ncbi:hypothetical protein [Segetibacter aerophilus]|uniref:Tetratricopeptide repeat protein n=1 Tax=Segetibacter aerophilus TaxID=670293 RepID=A0A512BJB0_9BACT|nr:hypothetical protein [Segetibacter aerophilus]GEO12046.1 hypothetical protein SAE01_45420 [Segetibacter aerophilus]
MKRITIGALLLIFIGTAANAQDFKKVRNAMLLAQVGAGGDQKLEEAKTELDKALADPKAQNNPEAYLLKTEVYGTIAGNNNLKAKYPNADVEGYHALKKYLELEPAETKLKEDKYAGVNSIYSSLFSAGVKDYNAKNWDSAYSKFKVVAELGDMFTTRKWSASAFDTTSYLYAGVTAQNAKKSDEAAKYYGKIAERKVVGADYEGIYDFLVKYYLNTNNQAEFTKYLALAKEAYPKNTLWNDLAFANTTDNSAVEDVVKKFETEDAAKSLSATNYLDYGDYFINNKKIKDLEPAKRSEFTNKAYYSFAKAAELDTANGIASYNAGVAAYTMFEDASDARVKIKGTTPDIKAKQSAADKVADAAADKSIQSLEKSFATLSSKATRSNIERNCLSKSTDLLYNLYEYKKNRARGTNPKDYDKYDAKSKYYDGLHGKFAK